MDSDKPERLWVTNGKTIDGGNWVDDEGAEYVRIDLHHSCMLARDNVEIRLAAVADVADLIDRCLSENGMGKARILIDGEWHEGPVVEFCEKTIHAVRDLIRKRAALPAESAATRWQRVITRNPLPWHVGLGGAWVADVNGYEVCETSYAMPRDVDRNALAGLIVASVNAFLHLPEGLLGGDTDTAPKAAPKTEDGNSCPECGRLKARTVSDAAEGKCPKWWAIMDSAAEDDCSHVAESRANAPQPISWISNRNFDLAKLGQPSPDPARSKVNFDDIALYAAPSIHEPRPLEDEIAGILREVDASPADPCADWLKSDIPMPAQEWRFRSARRTARGVPDVCQAVAWRTRLKEWMDERWTYETEYPEGMHLDAFDIEPLFTEQPAASFPSLQDAAKVLLPVFEGRHREMMIAKGRNPADYSSGYSFALKELQVLAGEPTAMPATEAVPSGKAPLAKEQVGDAWQQTALGDRQ
ncbi:hypothetical protein ACEUZ9_005476 [Paracoccus litorisediminis]|uniref:hypothetical protein n=1 Tax=Paracoccus litorisediminis TaxID=2006130 RepID=UPI00372F75F7